MTIDWHDPRISQVFLLMLPVTIGLGIVNLDQLINSAFGTLVSDEAPRAIENAFRVYMLPQGMFSVAVATVLFPTLSRMASRRDAGAMRSTVASGMRQINLLLIPSAAFMSVLATPIVRLLFQRGEFTSQSTHLVSTALFWFAFSLPFGGLNLLLTRTFFAVQRPWIRRAWRRSTSSSTSSSASPVQAVRHRRAGDRDGRGQRSDDRAAASAPAGSASTAAWRGADDDDHRAHRTAAALLAACPTSSGTCSTPRSASRWRRRSSASGCRLAGLWVYTRAVLAMRVPEAHQVTACSAQLGRA